MDESSKEGRLEDSRSRYGVAMVILFDYLASTQSRYLDFMFVEKLCIERLPALCNKKNHGSVTWYKILQRMGGEIHSRMKPKSDAGVIVTPDLIRRMRI